ncbi:VPS10 domain-containing protein [Ulvibacter antarcticus]|uniref:Putative secreted protein (Por secretion system target) n=1 Tax=Ulvibacter antarcticus TaxID=442714 RepID=A0A3L9YHJ8_9FLAO|nr:T9SS type A sorting domain-containing protein [Ulvibacter antarcticus]RMA58669.1 putative secreted protein (Por secretion system target) [Ulvibacter antarcticus]
MKKQYLLSLLSIAALCLVAFFSCSEKKSSASTSDEATLFKEYPHEHMYNQRAYPDNYINREAISEAIQISKNILANRGESQAADWELVGPLNTGGRITDVAISPDNDDHLYVAAAVGGIFRSYDRGANWTPIFDDVTKPSIGDIAIAPSNSQIIYAGTGEANGSATDGAYFGDGIYKSTDGGDTWNNIGLSESNHIGRIVIHPTNPDIVYVAATGLLYGATPDRGIYRTTNGGTTWEQVLYISDITAAIDVVINPDNPNILFAAMWERIREPWQRSYGGITSTVHKSTNGGTTWSELGAANGLPAPDTETGRIGLAISESNPSIIYARYTTNPITNVFNGIYKSTDDGNNWTLVTLGALSGIDASFGWYFGNIRVHPTNPDEVYVLGQGIARTTNSGTSWQEVNGMHVDHHALEYSRNNTDFILEGNDGGAYISENGGTTWTKFLNLPITQFYNIEVDYSDPQRLYGGTQDNNTIRTTTAGTSNWSSIWGGDGFHVNVDPNDNNYIYVESQYGNLGRSTNGGVNFSNATNGISGSDRNNWNTPVIISPFDSEIVYYGTNRLYSSSRASFWSAISPDLTDGPHPSGSLSYGTLTAIAASYNNLNTIYTGSDDGNVNVTFDGGTTWSNVSTGLPDHYITSIATVPTDDNIAYVTLSGYKAVNYAPHVFKTTDGGQNWVDISGNLPSIPVNDIVIYPSAGLLFVATDLNVWYSGDDGTNWDIVGNDLPFTITMDLKVHQPTNTLYAGTFGRSMHSYDIGNIILSTNDNALASEAIKMYPIPARTEFTIDHNLSSEGVILLYDISGKKIKTLFEGNFDQSRRISISTEGLANGQYVVKFISGSNTYSKQIIVKR